MSIHSFGRLFEEWFCDCFLQSENSKLTYLKFNQKLFRRDKLSSLHRQLLDAVPPRQIGSPATHLPSSFVRGYRHYRELYADAMMLPAAFGGIDYFLTFTTNPRWPEIVDNASIKDGMTRIRLAKRLDKAQRGLLGDVEPVGEGVCEMREFFGPGWRMYYVERRGIIIVMLGGGDKSSQQADIAAAIALAKSFEE